MNKKKYIAAVSCFVAGLIGFGSVYLTEINMQKKEENKPVQISEQPKEESHATSSVVPPKSVPQKDTKVEPKSEPVEIAEQVEAEKQKEADTIAEETALTIRGFHFDMAEGLVWPLEGDVLLNYSMDATTYFPTLEQYRYNPAIVISGEINDMVLAVAKGKIIDISTNEVTGCTVTEDLGDGYSAIYGQLKDLNFAVGDMVNAGQVLGYVSEPTKYYSVEGSNLYFAMEKDGQPINPMDYFQ